MFVQHVAMPNSLLNAWGGNLQELPAPRTRASGPRRQRLCLMLF